jgi:hypothetical protein
MDPDVTQLSFCPNIRTSRSATQTRSDTITYACGIERRALDGSLER